MLKTKEEILKNIDGAKEVNVSKIGFDVILKAMDIYADQFKPKPISQEETPIKKLIKQFEELKEKAPSIRDMVYLDGVLAVLDTNLSYETEYYNKCAELNAGKELPTVIEMEEQILKIIDEELSAGTVAENTEGIICNRFSAALKIVKYIQSLKPKQI
jgi:hypothetical protein